jgi:hypothetical protein
VVVPKAGLRHRHMPTGRFTRAVVGSSRTVQGGRPTIRAVARLRRSQWS